jgi:hypothetical protein
MSSNTNSSSNGEPAKSKRKNSASYGSSSRRVSFREGPNNILGISFNNLNNNDFNNELQNLVASRIGLNNSGRSLYLQGGPDQWRDKEYLPTFPPRDIFYPTPSHKTSRPISRERMMQLVHAASFNPDSLPDDLLHKKDKILKNQRIAKNWLKHVYPEEYKIYKPDNSSGSGSNNEKGVAKAAAKGGYLSKKKRINKYKSKNKSMKKRSSRK